MNGKQTASSQRQAPYPVICDPDNLGAHAVPHIAIDRRASIAAAAYEMAARRGFASGHELDDWLAAEREVDSRLLGEGCAF
jgi:Protein of unknown function (DUF2934)